MDLTIFKSQLMYNLSCAYSEQVVWTWNQYIVIFSNYSLLDAKQ